MIINPKIESLKPYPIDLTGYFVSAENLNVLRLALIGLKADTSHKFNLYPVKGKYNKTPEDSFFVQIQSYQKGLTDKILDIAQAFNQESVLANLTQVAIVYTDPKKPINLLKLNVNEVLHKSDIDGKVFVGDYSLIDIGGGWYQLVTFE